MERIVHIHNEWVLELCQNLSLINDRLNAAFRNDSSFAHFFHGKLLLGFLSFNSPYFTKAALSDTEMVDEVGL